MGTLPQNMAKLIKVFIIDFLYHAYHVVMKSKEKKHGIEIFAVPNACPNGVSVLWKPKYVYIAKKNIQ